MNKKSWYIIISVIVSSLFMSIVDGFIQPPYFYKSCIKLVLFLCVPLIYFLVYKDEVAYMKQLFVPKKKDLFLPLILGSIVFFVIFFAFLLLSRFIDFSSILNSLTTGMDITADNFLIVATYIAFVNSLLEEFFFRGYAFILLKEKMNRKFAYIFSAGLFAFYHAGMTSGWFNVGLYILMMVGLFVGGCIFNYLNEKCENIYPSWLVHMFANFAINTIGCIMFGII